MITLRDSAVQSKISLLFQMERPYRISANDPGIMQLVDYDLSEAERQLEIWMSNHPDDCIQEARKRGLPDLITGSLIREFERENWRKPSSFKELLEVLE